MCALKIETKKQANVAKLKSHLSAYIRHVKQGNEVIVLDRQTPVAMLIPYKPHAPFKLNITKATLPFCGLSRWSGKPIEGTKTNSLALLLKDRTKR